VQGIAVGEKVTLSGLRLTASFMELRDARAGDVPNSNPPFARFRRRAIHTALRVVEAGIVGEFSAAMNALNAHEHHPSSVASTCRPPGTVWAAIQKGTDCQVAARAQVKTIARSNTDDACAEINRFSDDE
jgi:hypothetical protein